MLVISICLLKGIGVALRMLLLLFWVVGQMLKPQLEVSWEDEL